MVDKILISEIKAETISFQILLQFSYVTNFMTAVLNNKEKTQKH